MTSPINSPSGWTACAIAFAAGVGGSFGYNLLGNDDVGTDRYYGVEGRAIEARMQAVEVRMAGDIATIKADIGHIKEQLQTHMHDHGNLP